MSDILSKIKSKRNRVSVPLREDYLVRKDTSSEELLEKGVSDRLPIAAEGKTASVDTNSERSMDQVEALRLELEKYPEIVRHSAIRLEKELDQRLTRFCKDNKCTIETFLEAAFEAVEADPDLGMKILRNAKNQYSNRKKAGKLRQLITQLEKVGN